MQNGVVKNHLCPECGREFKKPSKLIIHIRRHTGERPYTCDECSKSFIDNSSLTSHKRIHSGEKPHTCSICKRSFTDRCTLRRHVLRHIGEKNYICKICNKGYTTDSDLATHVKWHRAENTHTCDVCGKSFLLKSSLKKHVSNVHLKNKPHTCHICGRQFAERYNLVSHLRTHERSHACTICNKAFTLEKYLIKHLKKHTSKSSTKQEAAEEYPIEKRQEESLTPDRTDLSQETCVCKVCNKKLKSKGYLVRHMKSHEPRLFKCSFCRKKFRLEKQWEAHIKNIHGHEQFADCGSDASSSGGLIYINVEPDLKCFENTSSAVKQEVLDLDAEAHQIPDSLEIKKEEKHLLIIEDTETENSNAVLWSSTTCTESIDDFVNCDLESKHTSGNSSEIIGEVDIDPLM